MSERTYRALDDELNGTGHQALPQSMHPLQSRLQQGQVLLGTPTPNLCFAGSSADLILHCIALHHIDMP